HDQAASAEVANEAAEDCVSDASHGSENRGRSDRDGADCKALGYWQQGHCLADKACPELVEGSVSPKRTRPTRIVPELLHRSILLGVAKRKPPPLGEG